jgi:hypothetical protein
MRHGNRHKAVRDNYRRNIDLPQTTQKT